MNNAVDAKLNGLSSADKTALGYNGEKWTWKTMLLTNLGFWHWKWGRTVKVKAGSDEPGVNCKKLATIMGPGDPTKKTTIVWAFRKNFNLKLLDEDVPYKQVSNIAFRRIVFGLPFTWNERQESTAE